MRKEYLISCLYWLPAWIVDASWCPELRLHRSERSRHLQLGEYWAFGFWPGFVFFQYFSGFPFSLFGFLPFGLAFRPLMEKSFLWLSPFGLLNTLLGSCPFIMEVTLCMIPSELFALAWLPFSLASAPWAANYLGFGFYIRVWRSFFPNIPSELFALTWLPFGLASAPRARRFSCISKYFWALPCPFGSPRRKEWNGNLKCIVNLFRPLSYILTIQTEKNIFV